MNPIYIAAAIFALLLTGLVVWVLVQNTQDQKKNEALESQMNELRRDLLGLSTSQAQSAAKMQTIGDIVSTRLEAVTKALRKAFAIPRKPLRKSLRKRRTPCPRS